VLKTQQLLNQQDALTEFDTLSAGRFQALGSGQRVTYAGGLSDDRTELQDVFITERRGQGEDAVLGVLVAESGTQELNPDGSRYLVLKNGFRYEGQPGAANFRSISYDTYGVLLPKPEVQTEISDREAMSTAQLLSEDGLDERAELQWRIAIPLLVPIVADTGLQAARPLAWFMLTVCAALAFHTFVTLSVLLAALGGRNPLRHLKDVAPALLTAFSTASSAATLPLTLEVVEERAKVSPRTSNLVLPVGATVNMDGTALFECVTVLFLAQAYGIELSFVQQFLVLGMALVSSVGVAGIPAASFVAITIILGMVGLPLEAVALVLDGPPWAVRS
jgi:hypothetical protein